MYDIIAIGAQIRSKAKQVIEGERNTKFFLGLEKKPTGNTPFEDNNNNKTVTSNSEILHENVLFL